ncbi:Dbl homology domain-containing protein [Sporodiniella umbellata]|nr:Dbl homology domain-containing protein [Sporodiniella umbellata]
MNQSKQEVAAAAFNAMPDYHSPRGSFTSSSSTTNTSRFTSTDYLTAASFSSIDQPSNASSAIHYMTTTAENSDFDLIDSLDYDDLDEAALGHCTDHEYMYRKREQVVATLIKSEQSYTNSLALVQQFFLSPLKKETKQSSSINPFAKKPACTESSYNWLFGNFHDLIDIHQFILHSLNERMRMWGPTQILSDVFQSWFPKLEAYRSYYNNYSVSITTLDRLSRYEPFKKFIEKKSKEKALAQTDLLSLLQSPAACIPRYFETISQLSDMTPPMHPDYTGLLKCKQWMTQFKHTLNDRIADSKNVDKVYRIHKALDGCPFNDVAERRLLLQHNLCRVNLSTRSVGEERKYVLFSDFLVFARVIQQKDTTTRLQYKGHIVLDRARVRSLTKEEAGGIAHCIELLPSMAGIDNLNSTYVGTATPHILYVGSEEERKMWVEHLNLVIQNLDRIALMKQAQAHKRKIQERIPKGSLAANNMTHSMNPSTLPGSSRSSSTKSSSYTS